MNKTIISLLIAVILSPAAFGFTVILKSGKRCEGVWVDESRSYIHIKDKSGTILRFSKDTIDWEAMAAASRMPRNAPVEAAAPKIADETTPANYVVSPPSPAENRVDTTARPIVPKIPSGKLWAFYLNLSNVYDSNINHDNDNVHSVGVAYGGGVHLQNKPLKPTFTLDYEIARHSYSHTDVWDRISQNLSAEYEWPLMKRLTFEPAVEVSLKGSSEDREIGNIYALKPKLKYRITQDDRIEVVIAYRIKRYPDNFDRNANNNYVGIYYDRRFNKQRVEFGYRREKNNSTGPHFDWTRWIYSVQYTMPFQQRNWFSFEADYKPQRYVNRFADIVQSDGSKLQVNRYDKRWLFTVECSIALTEHLALHPSYQLETRASNDPDKEYTAHLPVLALQYRW